MTVANVNSPIVTEYSLVQPDRSLADVRLSQVYVGYTGARIFDFKFMFFRLHLPKEILCAFNGFGLGKDLGVAANGFLDVKLNIRRAVKI